MWRLNYIKRPDSWIVQFLHNDAIAGSITIPPELDHSMWAKIESIMYEHNESQREAVTVINREA